MRAVLETHEPTLAEVLEEVRRIDVQSRRLVTSVMAGAYRSVFRGSGIEFDAVREYVEGDDPRSVDWNVTARMGRPFVKTYVDERERSVLFVLDVSPSMSAGMGAWSMRRMAARVCAVLAIAAVRNGDRVGLVATSDAVDSFVTPKKGFVHALRVVRDCLALPAGHGGTALAPALDLVARAVRRHAVVFVLSDFLASGWEAAIDLCASRHDVVAVRLLPPDLDPPATGMVRVRDPETGRTSVLDTSSARTRAHLLRAATAWRARTERALRRAKVDLMDVPVPWSPRREAVILPILHFFRMRQMRGTKR